MTPQPHHIAIVAPSGYAPDEAAYLRGLQRLREQGHTVHDLSTGASRYQRFAASDAERVAQLHAAAAHPDAEIVIAVRGGYGLSRLLPEIDFFATGKQRQIVCRPQRLHRASDGLAGTRGHKPCWSDDLR